MAAVTVRRWIKWGSQDPEEPSSTLVLTSPQNNFVDLRILRSDSASAPAPFEPGKFFGAGFWLRQDGGKSTTLSLSHLEWGFAGTSVRQAVPEDRESFGVWTHWVDSRLAAPECEKFKDSGIMKDLQDASGLPLELESGIMVNPASGDSEAYDECWCDIPLRECVVDSNEAAYVVLKTLDENDQLLSSNKAGGLRGMIIRVGNWCQSFLRLGSEVACERWYFTDGQWSLEARVSDSTSLKMPSSAAFAPEGLIKGHIIESNGVEWQVEELGTQAI